MTLPTRLVLAMALVLSATQGWSRPAAAAGDANDPPTVDPRSFRNKVFEIKHLNPDDLSRALNPLGSGAKGATMMADRSTMTIAMRDFPDNLTAFEQALKRLDRPAPPRSDVELKLHVLLASSDGHDAADSATAGYPDDLKAV